MSKAFTRESDDAPDTPLRPHQPSPLPPGAKNYVTPGGARQLREEMDRLVNMDRSRAAGLPNESEAKRQLQILDERIRHLEWSLQTAVVVPPPDVHEDRVRFGATVTVRERSGGQSRYRIVGVDETNLDR